MQGFQRAAAAVTVVAVASIGAAACGSSSSSKTTAKAPATPSTASTTSTTPAGGPLTKAKLKAVVQPALAAQAEVNAAVKSSSHQTAGATISKLAAELQNLASQVGALKAPSAAAATAQQKFVSVTKQSASVLDQFGKAISANDVSMVKALQPKVATLKQQFQAAAVQLEAALP